MNGSATAAVLIGLTALAYTPAAQAGSATAGSIISRQDAIDQATDSMPAGSQITSEHCTTMIRDLSPRYRCTVQWTTPAAAGDG